MRLTPPITTGPMHPRPTAKRPMMAHVSARERVTATHARGCAR